MMPIDDRAQVRSRTERQLTLRVGALACIASCCLVVLSLWANRDRFDPEGISFLDMADAYRRGDWQAALIGKWSPLYPWLLALMMFFFNPSGQWEFTAVHALNFFIYLVTLASFSVFMREFLRLNDEKAANGRLPDWSWLALGYSLFTWSVIRLIPLDQPEPDLIVCALLYLIFALFFNISARPLTWGKSMLLGVLLGLGYLAKHVMFPIAFVFTAVALILARRSAKSLIKVLVSISVFVLLSLPYIAVLSNAHGRWMFSDAGWFEYAIRVNAVKHWNHWQGEEVGHGVPVHPTKKIHDNPPLYEFGKPFKVTYPPWYNPSYWYEGVIVKVDLQKQISVFLHNLKKLLFFLAHSPGSVGPSQAAYVSYGDLRSSVGGTIGSLLTLFCVLVLANLGRVTIFRKVARHWIVLVPIVASLGAYTLLHVEGRYIAAYVVVLWMVLFRSAAIPYSEESKRIFTAVVVCGALITTITLALGTGREVMDAARYFANGNSEAPLLQSGYTDWKVAKYLYNAGLREGEPVGAVGWTFSAYWARMARLHIVAEVPNEGARAFWSLDTAKRAVLMQLFRDVGAKAVVAVAAGVPVGSAPPNWQHIGDHYVYVFQNSDE